MILTIVILAPLSIGMVIEPQKIHVISGLFDAFHIYVSQFGLPSIIYFIIIALIFIGNCGNVSSWMISSTRSMHIACEECALPSFLIKTNSHGAPVGILVSEAILFSIFAIFFLFFESISSAYWIFLTLASQVALIYYMLIFAAAVKIKSSKATTNTVSFIPGGLTGTKIVVGIAGTATVAAGIMGFFPPVQQDLIAGAAYPFVLFGGIAIILAIPCLLLLTRTSKNGLKPWQAPTLEHELL
jgi:amino acid transporter